MPDGDRCCDCNCIANCDTSVDSVQSQASCYHSGLNEARGLSRELGSSKTKGRFECDLGSGCLSEEPEQGGIPVFRQRCPPQLQRAADR